MSKHGPRELSRADIIELFTLLNEELREADVRFLLRALNIEHYQDAVDIVLRYFDESRVPAKTWFALQELLPAP